jgi:uncharacterized protein
MSSQHKIVIGKSGATNVHLDLDVLLRTRLLIQANSGGGKSWVIRRLVEQAFGKIQIVIIDPEGEFATLREKFSFVLAGKGGDTPADVRSAELLAQRLLELRASCVCDIFEMKPSDRHRWVKLFLDSMLNAPKKLWHPVLVVVDEAHKYAPEKGAGESEASESMVGLCTTGRKRGFCAVFATQRLGKLRKDASAELLNRLVGPTFEDVDRKRASDLLGILKSDEKEFFHQIQMLEPGNFFALGRAISTERLLVKIGPVETTHPEVGAKYSDTPPPPPEKVVELLPKLADLPKQAEDRARTVGEMQAEIRLLRQQLRSRPIESKDRVVEKMVEVQVPRIPKDVGRYAEKMKKAVEVIVTTLGDLSGLIAETPDKTVKPFSPPPENTPQRFSPPPDKMRQGFRPPPSPRPPLGSSSNGKLRAGAERMLAALVQWHPEGMVESQMRSHAGMKKSGTFNTYMSDLRMGGYIENRNNLLYATDAGIEYFGGNVPEAPRDTAEVLAVWEPKLRDGARRMLRYLVDCGGEEVTLDRLADSTSMTKSGTFNTYLSDLRTARLIVTGRGTAAANRETLFLD